MNSLKFLESDLKKLDLKQLVLVSEHLIDTTSLVLPLSHPSTLCPEIDLIFIDEDFLDIPTNLH